jgi:hypothetical protein
MSKIPIKKIIIGLVVFFTALILLFIAFAATVTVKYGTPAEHGSSYKVE